MLTNKKENHMKSLVLVAALLLAVIAAPAPAEAALYSRYMGTTAYWYSGDTNGYCYTTSSSYKTSTGTYVCGLSQSTTSQGYVMVKYPGHTRHCFKRRFSYGFIDTKGGSFFIWTTNLYSVC